ncbi:Macrophage mannose receptor 1 [Liparis tanakae]|uniref:Macrophage mannose receptor 1 n=1 Tax=Liparis tanakae TaxID=230148 RepID=A0A4Z2GSX5_9TELE|nr:Macrophage mannose receptor 1 [Liparis tanakae]
MDKLLLTVVVVVVVVSVHPGLCAVSSAAVRRYFVVNELKTRTEAQRHCRENYMDLATIRDSEDQETLKTLKTTFHSRAWIGLHFYSDNWKWSLSNTSLYKPGETEFRRWKSRQPDDYIYGQHCVEMYNIGEWYDNNCEKALRSACFDVRGPNTYVITTTAMMWTEAQNYCREHHTDLASVRNMEENQMVQNLLPSSTNVWIGLFRDPWNWSDGSESLFSNWKPLEPRIPGGSSEKCVAADFSADGQWEILDCNVKSAFICYTDFVPVSKRVVKVRLEKSSSSLDLNDPVVMEDLLKQGAWIGLYFFSDNWKWSLSNTSLYKPGETEFRRWRSGEPDDYIYGQHCVAMNSNVWIGLFRDPWNWSDGSESLFSNWKPLEPRIPGGSSETCVAADFSADGQWEILDCNVKSAFICYTDPWNWSDGSESLFRNWNPLVPHLAGGSSEKCVAADFSADGQWEIMDCNVKSAFICYGGPNTYVLTTTAMMWTDAQSYCREHHTDLASVRNMEEHQMIQNLIPSSTKVWIGLFRDRWNWSDGSESLFWNWNPLEPRTSGSSETCVAADFSADGQWEILDCKVKSAFICYTDFIPVSKRVVKVRLERSSSSLDLNDPVVMDDLLKQLKQRMKDQGLNDDIKLSWKKQLDGKVFHKEEKKTKKKRRDEL